RPNSRARSGVPAGARWPRMRTRKGGIMVSVATKHPNGSPAFSSDPGRWAAVVRRDRRADGVFYYSVRTTGVYCRPSCAARLARRENVRFHATCADAERAGFNSGGRFYATASEVLGMTPTDFRAGGDGAAIRFAVGECSLGSILVAATERGVCSILLGDDPDALARQLQDRFPKARLIGGDRDFERLVAKVVGFVEAPALGLDLPLDVRGTAFQQRVWQALREIPAGATSTYTKIA